MQSTDRDMITSCTTNLAILTYNSGKLTCQCQLDPDILTGILGKKKVNSIQKDIKIRIGEMAQWVKCLYTSMRTWVWIPSTHAKAKCGGTCL